MPLDGAGDVFDSGLEGVLFVLVGVVVFTLIVIPVLLFGVELIALGVVLAAGLVGRIALHKPWTVRAAAADEPGHVWEWRIRGLRNSDRLVAQIAADVRAGNGPPTEFPGAQLISAGKRAEIPGVGVDR